MSSIDFENNPIKTKFYKILNKGTYAELHISDKLGAIIPIINITGIIDIINGLLDDYALKSTVDNHISDYSNPHQVDKTDVGLGNVDNTSDLNKPISIATQNALDLKADLVDGKVPASQLPVLVDEMLEGTYISPTVFNNELGVPYVPNSNNYYIDTTANKSYRWTGSIYTGINEGIALGETSSTAYRGDRGKIAYDHSQSAHAPANATVNDTDANLRNRATHTGTQLASTISDFAPKAIEAVTQPIKIAGSFTVTPAHNNCTIKVSGTTPTITFDPNTQTYPNKFSVYFLKMDATDATFAFTAAGGWTYTYDNLTLAGEGGRCGVLKFDGDNELILLGNE
jgi:hypothetical protein